MSISAISLQNSASIQAMPSFEASLKKNNLSNDMPLNFSKTFSSVLNHVNAQEMDATKKVNAVELGKSDDMVGAVVAAQKASLSFSALMQVRNKLLSGFDEIMKMPI